MNADGQGFIHNGNESANASDIFKKLHEIYCSTSGIEFMHLESASEREWLAREYEAIAQQEIDPETRRDVLKVMLLSQNFDHFVGSKFPTVKRYGGEGAEACMAFYREIFKLAAINDAKHVFMCMAHRGKKRHSKQVVTFYQAYRLTGRLNLLTGLLNCPNELMFSKMKGKNELPSGTKGLNHFEVFKCNTLCGLRMQG